ncbi:MAG: hypothetical protein Q8M16_23110 [Pirellulaceae bacterium]|nr:hypothetical protein [Pirellulaceae bacterium]
MISDEELAAKTLPTDEAERERELQERGLVVAERRRLENSLAHVLRTLGHELACIAPNVPVMGSSKPRVAAYFAPQCPLLRLVTGLCEGADARAAHILDQINIRPDANQTCDPKTRCLDTELAAVLPFDVATYRRSRPDWFRAEFDRQLQRCAWVVTLDGIYDKPDTQTLNAMPAAQREVRDGLARIRRGRAYRAQSAFLLRHSDILIAATNPDNPTKAGGTLETVREALQFQMPVVFIHTGRDDDNVFLIEPDGDLNSVLAHATLPNTKTNSHARDAAGEVQPPVEMRWQTELRQWVTQITSDPDSGLLLNEEPPVPGNQVANGHKANHGEKLMAEFFDKVDTPPTNKSGERRATLRERLWHFFEKRFRQGPDFERDVKPQPFATYRTRATDLNYHYSGQYRGAFLGNYALAIVAVLLATVSLTLLGTSSHTAVGSQIAKLLETAGQYSASSVASTTAEPWLLPSLLVLAVAKLFIVIVIIINTWLANRGGWNERAVDYRYLAERMRSMIFLPQVGSHQPPAVEPTQFASRVIRQSAVDWLFDAVTRASSPADLPQAQPLTLSACAGQPELNVQKVLSIEPLAVATLIRDAWITQQARYHERNARTMSSINHSMELVASVLGWLVIAIVAADLVLIGGKSFHWLPESWLPIAKDATPWLIFASALLPAIVAAVGGIRFQSECQRLAERSAVMRVMLAGKRPNRRSTKSWWQTVSQRVLNFPKTAQYFFRALIGLTPAADFPITGGRWKQINTLVEEIGRAQSDRETDLGSWSHPVLRITERVASDFVHEAAEWSVLYAKEVADPG